MKKLLTFTSLIGLLILGFHFYFQYMGRSRPVVNEFFINSAEIPAPFDGVRLVQLSDILIKDDASLTLLEQTVASVNQLNPEIIVFTGNLFFPTGSHLNTQVAAILSELDAGLLKIAVLGYHDLPLQDVVLATLATSGFRVLENESIQVFNQSPHGINVIGAHPLNDSASTHTLLDVHARSDRFNVVLSSVPTFTTVSFHHPVDLQLSGHCRGIQDTSHTHAPCFQFYNSLYKFPNAFTLHVSPGLARFDQFTDMVRAPQITSFLLIRP